MTSTYALPVSLEDNQRFDSTSLTLDQISWTHLKKAGIVSNVTSDLLPLTVADIGCGNGLITLYLLDKVDKIYAIDYLQTQLDETKKRVEQWIINNSGKPKANVEYICLDITKKITILQESIDLVFYEICI